MDELLRELLDRLDLVGQTHEEIYDSECRELMIAPIFHLFLKPDPSYEIPDHFGLHDENANQRVKTALCQYVQSANELAASSGVDTFHTRLSAFQNGDVASRVEQNYFDDFFGWMAPSHYDESGHFIGGSS